MGKSLVRGRIQFPAESRSFTGATVVVTLENVGLLDAPAEVVSQQVMLNVAYTGTAIDFDLQGQAPTKGQYNVRAHISMDGSDDVTKGDYITKQRYAVLQNTVPDDVTVEVERV